MILTTLPPLTAWRNTSVADDTAFSLLNSLPGFLMMLGLILLSFKGIIANIINLIIFVKLKKEDPININLLGLAFSDFVICLSTLMLLIGNLGWVAEFLYLRFNIIPGPVLYLTVGTLHTEFVRVTVFLTVFIAAERCLCVVFPLKVKHLITHRRVWVMVVFSYCFGLTGMIQIYTLNKLEWVALPGLNKSVLIHVMEEDFYNVGEVLAPIKAIVYLFIPFVVVTICTVVMIRHLEKYFIFRQGVVSNAKRTSTGDAGNVKEKRIVKMVIIICSLFIVCYIPNIALLFLVSFTRDYNIQRAESGTSQVVFFCGFFFDTLSSSVNIWIYYSNSSNYKKIFKKTFC